MADTLGDEPKNSPEAHLTGQEEKSASSTEKREPRDRREIRGNLPYSGTPGSISKVLDAIISAEVPDKFSISFMENILNLSGGGARTAPPLMKKMGFLSSDGTPTDRYSRFRTKSRRGEAALEGLKSAYAEIFKKNEYAFRASDEKVRDLIVEVTGLEAGDNIVRLILNTFNAIRDHVPKNTDAETEPPQLKPDIKETSAGQEISKRELNRAIGLSYHINIVLPETSDVMVFDAIFQSLRKNLL